MITDPSIRAQYFGFSPLAGHVPGCRYEGSNLWEVSRLRRERCGRAEDGEAEDGLITEQVVRLVCRSCQVVCFSTTSGAHSWETTSTRETGYGAKPERACGLWLHPGPVAWHGDERGPVNFYVTATSDRPKSPADVLGLIGWHLTRRGAQRWGAGLGCTDFGGVAQPADQEFTSRRAAVRWIADQVHVGGSTDPPGKARGSGAGTPEPRE